MRVLALTKYADAAASTRQRFIQYGPGLQEAGIDLCYSPLLGNEYLREVLVGRRPSLMSIARAYIRRLNAVLHASDADLVWVHCEFFPYWPGLAERIAAAVVRKPIVFDFDDAIFHMYDANADWHKRVFLKDKLSSLLERAAACTCGNAYLRDFAARYCSNSMIVPTVVNTDMYRPRGDTQAQPLTIGWIGSPSTWVGVRPILPILREIVAKHKARFLVVGAGPAAEGDAFPGMELRDWREASEIADVQDMDIGIMPLLDRPFERGKSGYKLIQYMACGLPLVASPIGVNCEIVGRGVNGFLAATDDEWRQALSTLIGDADMRRRFGKAGRALAVKSFSLASQEPRLIQLFRSLA